MTEIADIDAYGAAVQCIVSAQLKNAGCAGRAIPTVATEILENACRDGVPANGAAAAIAHEFMDIPMWEVAEEYDSEDHGPFTVVEPSDEPMREVAEEYDPGEEDIVCGYYRVLDGRIVHVIPARG